MLSSTLRLNFCYLKIIHILHLYYPPKSKHVCIHEIMRLIIRKLKMKMKNNTHWYDINRPKSRHGHKYTIYKMCLSTMMVICIKQHLSNILDSVHEKVKQRWGWVEKSVAYKKSLYFSFSDALLLRNNFFLQSTKKTFSDLPNGKCEVKVDIMDTKAALLFCLLLTLSRYLLSCFRYYIFFVTDFNRFLYMGLLSPSFNGQKWK